MKTSLFFLLAFLLTGCVARKITIPSQAGGAWRDYNTAKLVVVDSVQTAYAREGEPIFEELLKGKLGSLGYLLAESNADLNVEATITAFDPGNRALRALVGG